MGANNGFYHNLSFGSIKQKKSANKNKSFHSQLSKSLPSTTASMEDYKFTNYCK